MPNEAIESWIRDRLFDKVPIAIAVIAPDFSIVSANAAFEKTFGPWQGRKCYEVYKNRTEECSECKALEAFRDGKQRVNEVRGYDKDDKPRTSIKHTVPVVDDDGVVRVLVEMFSDVTELEQLRREHQLLFDKVPCDIAVMDRDLRIVKANERVRESFGDVQGKFCYEVFKGLDHRCVACPAQQSLDDNAVHTGHSIVQNRKGETFHLHVTTTPLGDAEMRTAHVMEMAVDVTNTLRLEDALKVASGFLETLVARSPDGVIAVDASGEVSIFNQAARAILRVPEGTHLSRHELNAMLPEGFLAQVLSGGDYLQLTETEVIARDFERVPVRLVGCKLHAGDRFLGMAVFLEDLTRICRLEKEKLAAERMAAVGETVAGLAHGIKNLLTGLEGGLYMLGTGLKKGHPARVEQGWQMLDRNVKRISLFVKDFLTFSKGRVVRASLSSPGEIAKDVVSVYVARADQLGVSLTCEEQETVAPAPLDRDGIHECLTNLVGNAIDACEMGDKGGCRVRVRTFEEDHCIVFEVSDDGCGMDYEVKRKVFTTFFTTKGLGGTGLGLLTTKRIIQEHGGKVELESEHGRGTTFRIVLPRDRLPALLPEPPAVEASAGT